MANKTASWQLTFGPAPMTKSALATALSAATISQIQSLNDPGNPIDETDTTLQAHFAAAITCAQAQLTALTGPAPNAVALLRGYRDLNNVAPIASARASRIEVRVDESW